MFDKDFFWNLFLSTGRVDAYLLLKRDLEKQKNTVVDIKKVAK